MLILDTSAPAHEIIDEFDEGASSLEPQVFRLGDEFCGWRLDKVVAQLLPEFSRSRIQQWIEDGYVTLNGQTARAKSTVYGDEEVIVTPQNTPEQQAYQPQPMELTKVYEDAAILVLDKPAGLVVHPGAGNWSGTLLNGLLHDDPAFSLVPRAGIVHRLDKDTSGLMVVAKTLQAQHDLVRQLQERSVKREYLALVWGTPYLSGTINSAIGRHPRERLKMAAFKEVREQGSAKPALTHYRRIASGQLDGKPVSLLHCRLETGRTHQIRVHLASIGFALVGDGLYGKSHLQPVFARQALQAFRLGLVHPVSQEALQWQVAPALDFAALLHDAGIALPEQIEMPE